ncbi:APC membrane recruitment protein 1 [Sinocyclocheilus rhinocerous]|uniref:APC membrane recruitment protein 1 n=1 Tax=Sinocyclocheilus rhinocerous TaxID=307959 RepID=A0A673NHN7_9TELE|nr:PREDICTED: APC membrane recruitment protein 1 [Sinocyclocheilus rhinocerous]XP_016409317.1 PREDICTED: APC membrane recruitment protein 1 [Sinocyclocheilus rhinocerous]
METTTGSEVGGAIGGPQSDSVSHDTPQPQSPPSVKIRKTAFKFFGGRKSICVLPSFFGGRGRSQRKGSSKTGVTKSQTYDGVSRACWEDLGRGSSEVASGDFEFCTSSDPQKSQEDHGKSQSLPRQRRGLRGLFSSIRRHRKNKNVELEKREALEMSSSFHAEIVPSALSSASDRSDNHGDSQGEELVPDVPNQTTGSEYELPLAATECKKDVTLVPEKRRSRVEVDKRKRAKEEENKGEEMQNERREGLTTYHQPLCAESELDRLAEQNVDIPDGEPPAASCSSENLIFGDVSSLKSFDSLTGCGDIIADQDDVSVAESSVSAERGSRNAGKRSSCFVTYQGGGEEMATPDEIDTDYLQSLWESETSNEVCYVPSDRGSDSPSLTPYQQISSIRVTSDSSPLGITETALTPVDLLSPQSDRQESVPNSDEGYYDSTTPGMEEESRERPHQERLPRDSYSGDALYELFEPDDRLLSPALPPNDAHSFVGAALQGDKGLTNALYALASSDLETGTMETEEERLNKIQHALLCCELQNLRSPSKDQLLFHADCFYDDSSLSAGNGKMVLEEVINQRYPQSPSRSQAVKEPVPLSRGQIQETPLFAPRADSGFSPHVTETTKQQPQSEDQSPLLPTRGCSQSQEELMVCFSQALVDFTKNTRLYHNSTESLDGSESSSPFGQSLSALPAIVTFDVVDMENESECEQQTELVEEEEELASPYEPFEDDGCYLQQDAFAECDQRTFDAYEQSLLLSNAWGIASLPRHLSLGRPCPPVPAPLALNRRSRSLDTDSLEFQTSDLYTTVTNCDLKGAAFSQRRTADCSDMVLPQQPCRVNVDSWRWGYGRGFDSSNSSQQEPKLPHVGQATVRPSHLPLKNNCRKRNLPGATRADGDGEILFGGGDALYPCSYPPTGMQWKNRPVGVTQGMPHVRSEQLSDHREIPIKNRNGQLEGGFTPAPPKL